MQGSLLVLVLLINFSAQTTVYHGRVICMHMKGNNSEGCLNRYQEEQINQPNQCCKTLEFIANKLGSGRSRNITIILKTSIYLTSTVTFKNYDFFAIQGKSETTKLNCKCRKKGNYSVGLSFVHINNLQLSHSAITLCCGAISAYSATILVQECSNITIKYHH